MTSHAATETPSTRGGTDRSPRSGPSPARRRVAVAARCEALEDRRLPSALVAGIDGATSGVVLRPQASIVGTAEPGAPVRLRAGADLHTLQTTHAGGDGRFAFAVNLPMGNTAYHITARAGPGPATTADLLATRGDVLIAMNAAILDAIRADSTSPPMAARNLAMAQLAADNAIAAATGRQAAYGPPIAGPRHAAPVAAAALAADRVADALYPDRAATFDAILRDALAAVPAGRAKADGLLDGRRAADAILALRAADGANAPAAFTPGQVPGDWVPTPPRYQPAIAPQFARVPPFLLARPDQFLPPPPPLLGSPQYAAELAQVQSLGAATSTTRTPDQTALARFWSDTSGTTFTPPGHWNQVARDAALGRHLGLAAEARLFAALDAALADAGIACWDAKYTYDRWRPVTAIRQAGLDGNPATVPDPTWTPLWPTPAFPSYDSGHSTFSGAAQVVLEAAFGNHFAFEDRGDPTLGLPPRHFDSFGQAAEEAGFSRVVGGIHFASDNLAGLAQGRVVGRYDLAHFPGDRAAR